MAAIVALAAASAGLSACFDGNGYSVQAANEWDRDVIVALGTGQYPHWLRVPAGSTGSIASSLAPAEEGWQLQVLDDACQPLATIPFTRSIEWVHIDPSGAIEAIRERTWKAPVGLPGFAKFDETTCP